ncbi:MAG: hypothetical protein Q9214_002470 [Letrouitia sp. 1 TL-2023]
MTSSLAHYYSEASLDPSLSVFEPAQAAYDQALETFKQNPTRHLKKRRQVLEATSLQHVLDTIAIAQKCYADAHSNSKTRRCIAELSKRICYYGNVMDVFVQHHPGYVALAWGTMKLAVGAVVEHENLGRTIITGLCDIANVLPRIEIAAYLYPTSAVKQAVSALYAYIIKFLLRSLDWYEEGKIAHAIHSITKPAALRYDDLLEDIRRATRRTMDLAIASSQAEQRDIHHELQSQTIIIKQLREDMLLDQSIKATQLLECRQALSEIQAAQALTLISSQCSVDHKAILQASLFVRDKHRFVPYRSRCPPFWTSSKLHEWNVGQHSSSITIRAYFKNRFYIRDFCINIIQQLRNAGIAVLWVLKPKEQAYFSIIEILKSLIHQVLTLDSMSRTGSKLSSQMRQFQDAHFDKDYANLLGSILEHFRLVYIMVEAGAMDSVDASRCREHLQEISSGLSERNAATIVKIMFLSYGPDSQYLQKDSILLKLGRMSPRKGKRIPPDPLQNVASSGPQNSRRNFTRLAMPFYAQRRTMRAKVD